MARTAITLLLGLAFTATHATAIAHATCEHYVCPLGWYARGHSDSLQCLAATGCTEKDKGTCCLEGQAPPSTTTDGSPCTKVTTPAPTPPPKTCSTYTCPSGWMAKPNNALIKCWSATGCTANDTPNCCVHVHTTPAPTPGPSTTLPAKTCLTYTCPTGWGPKPNNGLIRCWAASGCTAKDTPNCCLQVTTLAPTPAPTAAPTPSPPVVPGSCKVQIPKDGFAPWHVYQIMKASTPKIDTVEKLLMGGQTLNITGVLDIRASKFHCEYADHEMRAVLDTGSTSPVATMNVHTSLYPSMVTTQCLLTQISLEKSVGTDIPGLRFDYDDCPFGPAKKATLLVGLKKVPNNWGKTPGLADFFKDVCHAEGAKGGDSRLRFDLIDLVSGLGCWAQSADYTLMTSQRDCFEPAMVFTLMDPSNHFALFPVTDIEWEYLQKHIPKPAVLPSAGGGSVPQPAGDSPCATAAPVKPNGPHVYGHILQNRLCVAMPELGCHSYCGKVCTAVNPVSGTTTISPTCTTCYDCEIPEMFYAFWCTIFAFMICHTYHKWCSGGVGCCRWSDTFNQKYWTNDIKMPELPYSQLTQPRRAFSRETCCQACVGMFFLSFFSCLMAFTLVNLMDYAISVHWHGQEMCLKVFDWQNFQNRGYWWRDQLSIFTCVNDVCFYRLFGLFVTVWMSLWGLFCYWRYFLQVTVEKQEIKRIEAKVEFGGGGGAGAFAYGGAAPVACTVQ